MKREFTNSFDDLIQNYYASPPRPSPRNVADVVELFAHYYGGANGKHHGYGEGRHQDRYGEPRHDKRHKHAESALSLSYDDGEMISAPGVGVAEYVVQKSAPVAIEEYVVPCAGLSAHSMSMDLRTPADPPDPAGATEEYGVDILQPLRAGLAPSSARFARLSEDSTPRTAMPVRSSQPAEESQSKPTDDDFMADMQSILTGQKAYDPVAKKTMPKDALDAARLPSAGPRAPEPENGTAIFDRIAQSMQYANKYDLGTVELQNRFSDFDRNSELQQRSIEKKAPASSPGVKSPPSALDNSDFLEDLDTMRQRSRTPLAPEYAAQSSTDKWDRIANELFGEATYDDFLAKDLQSVPFLGQTISSIHDETARKLAEVEKDLKQTQGAGYLAPPVSSTLRKRHSLHGWGMAIDFDVMRNPYVLNEHGENALDQELIVSYDHVADFMLGKSRSSLRDLKGGRSKFGKGTVGEVYDTLRAESDAMKHYFSLRVDATALAAFLAKDWPAAHSGQTAPAIGNVQTQIQEDYEVLGGKDSVGKKRPTNGMGDRPFAPSSSGGKGDPADGFLNLPREFVLAMTDAGFAWGAIDIPGEPGDIQHFDLRLQGIGAKVYKLHTQYK
jgi:hypothetical protein